MPFDNLKRSGPQRGTGERAINLPPAILWLIAINVVVHLLRQLLSDSVDQQLVIELGLVPANFTGDQGNLLSMVASPFTYQFLHGSWVHLGQHAVAGGVGAPVERLLGCAASCCSIFPPASCRRWSMSCFFPIRSTR
jgi:membrane associated rhomboid family serine protease